MTALLLLCLAAVQGAGSLKGIVLSADRREPLQKVTVYLAGTSHRTDTGEDGRFEIDQVPPGDYLLIATAVGFGLVKKEIAVSSEGGAEIEILLGPGTQIVEEVTVVASRPSHHRGLNASDIDKLKTVMTDDPIRALQQQPGLVSNDDFNSGFALQGSGFDRVGVLFDGVPVYAFFHTVEGSDDTGSTSLLSADLIEGVDLIPGGTSAEWGGNSGGFVSLVSRSGNRSRWRNSGAVSASAAMFLSEGPLGNGSWIVSARKSYIDWIVRKIEPRADLNFGFSDAFGKIEQAWGKKHTFSFSFHHGHTGLHNVHENIGLNSIRRGGFTSGLAHLNWTTLWNDRVTSNTHGYWQQGESRNRNRQGRTLWVNEQEVAGVRQVWDARLFGPWTLSGGLTVERWRGENQQETFSRSQWVFLSNFQARTDREEAFVQLRGPIHAKLAVAAGWAGSRLGAVSEKTSSPFVGIEFKPTAQQSWTLFAGATHQFPFLNQLYGEAGNPNLRAEAARTVQGGWTWQAGEGYELRVWVYHRRRDHIPWRAQGLWRLVNGTLTPPSSEPFQNLLKDRSSGAEIQMGRRRTNGLNGWLAYAWGQSGWSEKEGVWFPGNYDQRNAASLFAHYRWSSQLDLSLKWKYAGGLPIPAYVRRVEPGGKERYFLAPDRNLERLPAYARLDGRLAKSFNRDRYRMTLFVEVLNLLGRENRRFSGFGLDFINLRTGQIDELVQPQFPFLPTAGLLIEF